MIASYTLMVWMAGYVSTYPVPITISPVVYSEEACNKAKEFIEASHGRMKALCVPHYATIQPKGKKP